MTVPEWLRKEENIAPPTPHSEEGKKKGFVERTIVEITQLIEESVFSEKYAKREGLLQGIDPRIKLVSLLLFIVTLSLLSRTEIIIGMYIFSLLLAYLSNIDLYFFIKRVWVFIPLFTGIIAFPSIFSLITPGEPLFVIYGLIVTKPGLFGAILFVSRVVASVSFAILLVLTTKWTELMRSLRILGVPQVFVLVLAMTYRYIFLLLKIVQDMHLARRSRTIKTQGIRESQNWVTSRMGFLFIKSLRLSEDVHSAMIARGFRGEVLTLERFKVGKKDYLWLGFATALCSITLLLNYFAI